MPTPWTTVGSVSWEFHPLRVRLKPRAEVSLYSFYHLGKKAHHALFKFLCWSLAQKIFEVMAAENKSLRQKRKVSQHWYSVFKLQRGRFPLIYFGHLGGAVNNSREVSFTLNGHFIEKIWGIRCKFFVNFHCAFIPLTLQRTFFSEWTPKRL